MHLKANTLYIETKSRMGIGLKLKPLLLKPDLAFHLKIAYISPKNSVSLIGAY
jgi:hypothetical protein